MLLAIRAAFVLARLILGLIKLAIMNRPLLYSSSIFLALLFLVPILASARPVDFSEVSLLVRSRESEASIRDEVSRRKLMRPLTPQQEGTLKAQGASDSLLQSLRNATLIASKDEVEALASSDRRRAAAREEAVANQPQVHIFNVAFGHPINLSEYGGADYEIAFYSFRFAGEDEIQPAMIDNVRTGTDVSRLIPTGGINENQVVSSNFYPANQVQNWGLMPPNVGRGSQLNFGESVAISSRSFSRPMHIDWESPVYIPGQPYAFYHVYGAGGVSLYYIGKASEQSARVAVVTNRVW